MPPHRVVFDCNVFLQSLISPNGPAAKCLGLVSPGKLELFCSRYVLDELRKVALRDFFRTRFHLTEERIDLFIKRIVSISTVVEEVPHVFEYPRDPSDAHYVDLAIATGSHLLVSRDKDLLALADPDSPEGALFLTNYPNLRILTPVEMLTVLID